MASAIEGDGPEAQYRTERWRIKAAPWLNSMGPEDRDLILEFLDAIDPDNYGVQPGEIGTKSQSTLTSYGQNLRLLAKAAEAPLAELTVSELNRIFSDMDVSQNTVSQRQSAARVFYRYHDQLGVDEDLITIDRPSRTPVQPRDLFTREEIDKMHDVMSNDRDRAMIDLMLYTGQRVRAIQTLRVKDIDLENQRFYLNTEDAGLKGAEGMRPMLIAGSACADWMADHPASDDPDAYFITKLPGSNKGSVHKQLHQVTIYRRIQQIAEEAGIDRWKERAHAHNFRHTFVRWAYINKGMDLPTIKYMMGHSKESQTLEKTYMNILEVDFAQMAEEAAGVKSPEQPEDHVSPEVCPWCDRGPLPKDAKSCPWCMNLLGPDALKAQEERKADVREAKDETDDIERYKKLDQLERILDDNPELLDAIESMADD